MAVPHSRRRRVGKAQRAHQFHRVGTALCAFAHPTAAEFQTAILSLFAARVMPVYTPLARLS